MAKYKALTNRIGGERVKCSAICVANPLWPFSALSAPFVLFTTKTESAKKGANVSFSYEPRCLPEFSIAVLYSIF